MARYIDADFVLPHIEEEITICKEQETVNPTASANRVGLQVARSFIVTAPTADVEEVKHGKWIEIIKDIGRGRTLTKYQCNKCGVYTAKKLNYCPHCGAKMDGGYE